MAHRRLGKTDNKEDAIAFWSEAEGIVCDHDRGGIKDDEIEFCGGFGKEGVGDAGEEVFGGMREGFAAGDDFEVFGLAIGDGLAPAALFAEYFGEPVAAWDLEEAVDAAPAEVCIDEKDACA